MYILSFILAMVVPAGLLAVGVLWRVSPPPFRAGGLAYNTALSAKSEDAWAFAHRHCSRLWTRLGLILGVLSAVVMWVFRAHYKSFLLWLIGGQTVFFCLSALLVDALLKNTFDEDGNYLDGKK